LNTSHSIIETGTGPAACMAAALELGFSLAWYRLPGEKGHHLIIDTGTPQLIAQPELEKLETGFLFAPFEPGEKAVYLHSDLHLQGNDDGMEAVLHLRPEHYLYSERMLGIARRYDNTEPLSPRLHTAGNTRSGKSTERSGFLHSAGEAVRQIGDGRFSKVVLARRKKKKASAGFQAAGFFQRLCEQYPNAFVSLVSTPMSGTWIGATPEILLRVTADQTFHTIALAGTQPWRPTIRPSRVAWTQKAIEEQAMVSRYIINCFKKIRLREFQEDGPKTARAGNLVHLRTDYHVNLREVNFPNLGTVMLRLLHPTSAVCGMPGDEALAFIRHQEDFDRAYYAGYLGPVNVELSTHLYVNLRCMQIKDAFVELYAGAGITLDSEPEKEWRETSLKIRTLESVMHSSVSGNCG
jgi:isochorismate synthase